MRKLFYPLMLLLSMHVYGQDLYYTYHGKKIPLKADSSAVYVEFDKPESAKLNLAKSSGVSSATLYGTQGILFHNARNEFWNKAVSREKDILFSTPILRTEKSFIIPRPFILLRLKNGEGAIKAVLDKYALGDSKYESLGSPGMYKITCLKGSYLELLKICNRIAEDKNITWCEPDFFSDIKPHRRGPLYPDQYYLNNTGQSGGTVGVDIRAEGAWLSTTGAGTLRVAVIDEGMDAHEDYAGRLLSGYTTGNPSGNGAPGYAGAYHGVACAGIIGATHNNGLGIRGVAPGVQLIPVNIFPSGAAPDSDIAAAINWAWNSGAADVLSCSWGGGEPSNAIRDAFNSAMTLGRGGLGSIVVASSGNGGNEDASFPSNLPGIITVGACDHNGVVCGYSQRGASMDVVAPSADDDDAGGIFTTDRMGANGANAGNYMNNFGGTSAACPQVSGIAALILSINPNLTVSQVTNAIQRSATDVGPAGFDHIYGFGRANACRALEQAIIETGISGPAVFCGSSASYSISNYPGFTFQGWSIPVGETRVTLSTNGNSATLTKLMDAAVMLTATYTSPCGGTMAVNKVVTIGLPILTTVNIENLNYPGNICYTDPFNNAYPIMEPPGSHADYFDVTVTPPTGSPNNFTTFGTEFVVPVRRPGTHTISVTPVNACGTGAAVVFDFDAVDCSLFSARSAPGSKTSASGKGITVSPNPAYKTAVVTFNGQQKISKTGGMQSTEIRVLDMNGAVKLTKRVPQGTNNVPLEIGGLPAGMYIVETRNGGVSHTAKLMVTR